MSSEKENMSKATPILKFLASAGGRIVLTIVFALIVYGILLAAAQADSMIIVLITFIICGYFGWKSLDKITPEMFLWMPIAAWVNYYIIKGLLSIFIGALVAPFWIGKKISSSVMEYVDVAIDEVIK